MAVGRLRDEDSGAITSDSKNDKSFEGKPADHMIAVIRDAIDCLETGRQLVLSYQRALKPTEVIFAFYESVRTRGRVSLPLTNVSGNPLHDLLDLKH